MDNPTYDETKTQGVLDEVLDARNHQVYIKGFDDAHDDTHDPSDLVKMGLDYSLIGASHHSRGMLIKGIAMQVAAVTAIDRSMLVSPADTDKD